MAGDDELALTATAPGPTTAATPASHARLGRFELERELGAGGMGVVHAAYDPELQRRVAVKVLRHTSPEARARLLREARAMAKLSHPNVITVFDVGSDGGEDYVAMELIDGGTLGDWLARHAPSTREIVAAFVAAGRGLAAAHAEGLIHRDFKPANVLRSTSGRIVVTDFGLARAEQRHGTDDASRGRGGERTDAHEPRPAALTQTGSLTGTPAYMAPEQWTGGALTAATDQFAFCVALWEALAGARPFGGAALDDVRRAVLTGPDALDASALPRRLRAIVRRGLAIDPASRWPSIDALLAAIERTTARRRWLAIAASTGVVAAAVATVALRTPPAASASDCTPAALDPDVVWSPARAAALGKLSPEATHLIERDIAAWRATRQHACAAPLAVRSARLACLDGSLQRLDAMLGEGAREPEAVAADHLGATLVDPALCDRPQPPRIVPTTPALAHALARRGHALGTGSASGTPDAAADPCTRTIDIATELDTTEGFAVTARTFADANALPDLAARCGDDALTAIAAIANVDPSDAATVTRLEAAAAVFPQDDVRGQLAAIHAHAAVDAQHWDDAWAGYEQALELFGHRARRRLQLNAVLGELRLLEQRGRPEDLARIEPLIARWQPVAAQLGRSDATFDERVARIRWSLGDVATADAALDHLAETGQLTPIRVPLPPSPAVDIEGTVVDAAGAPVAGASVAAAPLVMGDPVEAASPMYTFNAVRTRSDAAGHFTLEGAHGYVVAQAGTRRALSMPVAATVTLTVRPTTHIAGTVDLAGKPANQFWVITHGKGIAGVVTAPVRPDATFRIDGVLPGPVDVVVSRVEAYDAGNAPLHLDVPPAGVDGLALHTAQHELHVIARSAELTPPDGVFLWLYRRYTRLEHPTTDALKHDEVLVNMLKAAPADPARVPAAVKAQLQPDDQFATMHRPDGEVMVCAMGFSKKQLVGDDIMATVGAAVREAELGCARVAPDQDVVIVDVPPVRKLRK